MQVAIFLLCRLSVQARLEAKFLTCIFNLDAFRIASAVTQQCFWDLLGFSTRSSIRLFVHRLAVLHGAGTCVTDIYAVLPI